MKEKLTLVTSFAELRAGMIVVVKSCQCCGRDHRHILTANRRALCSVHHDPEQFWVTDGQQYPTSAIAECSVRDRRVYRVDDGLEDTQATHTAQPKHLERTR